MVLSTSLPLWVTYRTFLWPARHAAPTPVSCWESQASIWLWWGNSFWATPPPPLACTALECHRMYSHQGAITLELRSQNQPRMGWHKGGTGIQTQKWVYPFTCITSATERLYPVPYTIQSRWWLARPQGLLWQGMVLLGVVGSGKVRLQQGGGKAREVHPHCLISEGVSRQPWQRPELRCLSTAARRAQPSQAAVGSLHAHTHTHTPHTKLCAFRAIRVSQPEEKWDLLHCCICGISFISFSKRKACHINKMSMCVSFYCFWMPCKRNTAEHTLFIKVLMGRKVYLWHPLNILHFCYFLGSQWQQTSFDRDQNMLTVFPSPN